MATSTRAIDSECGAGYSAREAAERRKFIEDEITFTDGTSGKRTAEYILKVLEGSNRQARLVR